jgi:hypothetical protein
MNASMRNVIVVALSLTAFACGQKPSDTRPGGEKSPSETRKSAEAGKVVVDFEDGITGTVPKGWTVAETKGAGTPATWRIDSLKDDPKHRNTVKVDSKNKEAVFNLLMSDASYAADLDLSVAIKSGTGEDDQGGGLVWRAKDADNYYITRWNPLEKNIRLYRVDAGVRTTLKSVDGIEADAKQWHAIAISHQGKKITVKFDDKVVIEAEDEGIKDGGKVGLWTKADASSWFDDVVIVTAKK